MSTFGALFGLSLSIILIIRKVSPAYSLIIGAVIGGLLGGITLNAGINRIWGVAMINAGATVLDHLPHG